MMLFLVGSAGKVVSSLEGFIIENNGISVHLQVHAAVITEECGLNAGYIGPVNLKVNGDAVVLFDKSLEGRNNLSCGANESEA